jgi:hypothetical protein
MGVLYVEEGGARLDFIQNMEYKFVELLSIQFHVVSDEMLRRKIMYRYLEMKVRLWHSDVCTRDME